MKTEQAKVPAANPPPASNPAIVEKQVAASVITTGVSHLAPQHMLPQVLAILILLAAALAGLYYYGLGPKEKQENKLQEESQKVLNTPPLVVYTRPFYGPKVTTLTLPGNTQGYYQTTIYARVDGYLQSWVADYGERVKVNQLLATVDTPNLDQQLLMANAELEVAKANSVLTKAKLDFAKVSFDRWESAVASGAVSKEERDSRKADLDTSAASYKASLAQIDLADARVKNLQVSKSFSKVVAPFDGVITNRLVDIGALIAAGGATGTTAMYDIAQLDRIRVFIKVPQTALPAIKIGMEADVLASEFPGRVFKGTVTHTAEAITTDSRTLLTEVEVPNKDITLVSGMYVQVRFQLAHDPPNLLIPTNAFMFRSSGPQVAVLAPDNRLHFQSIRVARDYGDKVEIAEGLKGGERIAINLNIQLQEGDPVTPQELKAPGAASQPAERKNAEIKEAESRK